MMPGKSKPSVALLLGKPDEEGDEEGDELTDEDGVALLDRALDTDGDAADRMSAFRELMAGCR